MYSLLRDPNAFLGFYFNIYFMFMETGVKSDLGAINSECQVACSITKFWITGILQANEMA